MVSKFHVTAAAGIIAIVSLICATVVVTAALGRDAEITTIIALAAPFLAPVGIAIGVIGGVAVPTDKPV